MLDSLLEMQSLKIMRPKQLCVDVAKQIRFVVHSFDHYHSFSSRLHPARYHLLQMWDFVYHDLLPQHFSMKKNV